MEKNLKLIPMWLWVAVIVIIVLLCSCRGGRSLGSGSAGTVIVPQTPKQINERNRQPPRKLTEPIPPVVVTPPVVTLPTTPPVKLTPAKTRPTTTTNSSAKANPVIINPKPAGGESKPFSPSVSSTPKLIEGDGGCIVITDSSKNPPTDNKATTPKMAGPYEATATSEVTLNWGGIIMLWMILFLAIIFGWIVFDTIKDCLKNFRDGKNAKSIPAKKKVTKKRKPITKKKK